jgi:hypothetical protein
MLMPFTSRKDHGRERPGPLVTVDERVVADDMEEVRGGHREQPIMDELATERCLWLRNGRLEESAIA